MAAQLTPPLKQRFFNENGEPLALGMVYSYEAGSTTPQATFTDQSGLTPNTNPVILDINGYANIWLDVGKNYKFIVTDADGVEQFTVDDVTGQAFGAPGLGDVSGPEESVDNELALFSGTSGKFLKRATGTGFVKVTDGVVSVEEGGGLPPGGAEGDYIEKLSSDDGDADWESGSFSGYSSRYSANLDLTGIRNALLYIFNFSYLGPLVSLSGSSNVLREKGDAVTSLTLTANITKRSDPIEEVRFYQNPSTLLDTQTSGGGIPNGGNSTYNWSGSFSDNTTFRVEVDDNGASGGPTTASNTTTYSFVYPYYVGAGAAGLSASSVAGLTKRIIASTTNRTETITASNGDVFYFAYPASYGALTSILDVNNFETIGDWTLRTENITGLDGNPVSYRIYEFDNPVTAGSYQYTFKR